MSPFSDIAQSLPAPFRPFALRFTAVESIRPTASLSNSLVSSRIASLAARSSMLFSCEKRLSDVVHINNDLSGIRVKSGDTNAEMLGPGKYYNSQEEAERNGWKRKSFSKREPMSSPDHPRDRSMHYTSAVMYSTGLLSAPSSGGVIDSPGPGHYNVKYSSFDLPEPKASTPRGNSRPSSANNRSSFGTPGYSSLTILLTYLHLFTHRSGKTYTPTKGHTIPLSPRMSSRKTLVKYGLVIHGAELDSESPGPGHYHSPSAQSGLLKKSFNTRVTANSKSPMNSGKSR